MHFRLRNPKSIIKSHERYGSPPTSPMAQRRVANFSAVPTYVLVAYPFTNLKTYSSSTSGHLGEWLSVFCEREPANAIMAVLERYCNHDVYILDSSSIPVAPFDRRLLRFSKYCVRACRCIL